MSVPFRRQALPTYADMQSSKPVSASTWSLLGNLANWCNGRGGQVVPCEAVMIEVAAGTSRTLWHRFQPKQQTTVRVWSVGLLSDTDGASATVTINGTAFDPVYPATDREDRRGCYIFAEKLSSKSSSVQSATVTVAASGGDILVESISAYDQARKNLAVDTADDGVNLTSLRARQPIIDFDYTSISGVADAERFLDARRLSYLAWAVPTQAAISPSTTTLTDLFAASPRAQTAQVTPSDTSASVSCAVFAKVSGGTGRVAFLSTQAGASTTMSITSTSFAWVTATLPIETEDLTQDDGSRSGVESIRVQLADPAAQTLRVAAIQVYRAKTDKV